MKYALTVNQSVLFGDLSYEGNRRWCFKKALGMDYELPECLISDGKMYWNYDDDVVYNQAILSRGSINEAVGHYIRRLTRAAGILEKVTQEILQGKVRKSDNNAVVFRQFRKYAEAYILSMPFLYTFWNTEKLLLGQLEEDFEEVFGKEVGEEKLRLVLIPIRKTYFAKELNSFEKILLKAQERKEIGGLIDGHIENFAFTSFVTHIGEPMTEGALLKRIKAGEKMDIKKRIREKRKQITIDERQVEMITNKLKEFQEIRQRIILAQELMYWRNQRLDVMWRSDYLSKPLFERMATIMGLTYKEFVYLRYEEVVGWWEVNKKRLPSKREIHRRMKS